MHNQRGGRPPVLQASAALSRAQRRVGGSPQPAAGADGSMSGVSSCCRSLVVVLLKALEPNRPAVPALVRAARHVPVATWIVHVESFTPLEPSRRVAELPLAVASALVTGLMVRSRTDPVMPPADAPAGERAVGPRPARPAKTKTLNCNIVADNIFSIMVQQPHAAPLRPLHLKKLHYRSNIGDAFKAILSVLGYSWAADGTTLKHSSCGTTLKMGKWSGTSRRPEQPVHQGIFVHCDDDCTSKLNKILAVTDRGSQARAPPRRLLARVACCAPPHVAPSPRRR